MAISDKTRKILWGRSGNRCAICKRELVEAKTSVDDESVIAEECHIVSGQPNGPRNDQNFPPDQIDSHDNLILLCRVHHKMVDDQFETYTEGILHAIKEDHEKWVSEKLTAAPSISPIKLKRVKENIPPFLVRLKTGKDVLNVMENTYASSFDHDDLYNEAEVNLVGGFLQTVRDWNELGLDEPSQRASVSFELTQTLNDLEAQGFYVFGAREIRKLEGGVKPPSNWPIAILQVVRKTSDSIVTLDPDALKNQKG